MRSLHRGLIGALLSAAAIVTATAPAAAQTTTSPLSAARYTALDQGYTFLIALDRDVTTPRLDNLERYCATLDLSDALQGVLHEQCLLALAGYPAGAAAGDCDSRASCRRALIALQPLLKKSLRVLRKQNRVFDAQIPAGACRTAVRASSAELRGAEIGARVMTAMERALRTGSENARRQALRLIALAERASSKSRSLTKQRKEFRKACGPGPVVAPPASQTSTPMI